MRIFLNIAERQRGRNKGGWDSGISIFRESENVGLGFMV